jgi:enoyl-CoA hydratase/carnithine racemase
VTRPGADEHSEGIVASEPSVFSLPEVTQSLIATVGGVYRHPRAMPAALAFELIAAGRRARRGTRSAQQGVV